MEVSEVMDAVWKTVSFSKTFPIIPAVFFFISVGKSISRILEKKKKKSKTLR